MGALRITLESLRLTAAQPSTWLILAGLLLVWPLWTYAARIGISSYLPNDSLVLYNVAITAFAWGAVRGIGPVARLSRSIAQISRTPGLPTRMLGVGAIGLLQAVIASTPAILMGEPLGWTLGVRLAVVFLTIVSFSSLLLRFEVEVASASWLLGIAILLAPLLLPDPLPTRSLLLLSAALLSAAWLLDHPPGRTT